MRPLLGFWMLGFVCFLLAGCEETPEYNDYTRRTRAPGVDVMEKRDGGVRVRAPGVYVESGGHDHSPDGVKVKAPFTHVETDGKGGKRVRAPFTDIETREPAPAKPAPTPERKTVPYSHPQGWFTVAIPADWKAPSPPDEMVAAFEDPTAQAGMRVGVLVDRQYDPSELKSVSEHFFADCQAKLPEMKRLSTVLSQLGGHPAYRTDATFIRRGVASRGVMVVSIQGGRTVVLTVRAEANSYITRAPTLEAIIASYKASGR